MHKLRGFTQLAAAECQVISASTREGIQNSTVKFGQLHHCSLIEI